MKNINKMLAISFRKMIMGPAAIFLAYVLIRFLYHGAISSAVPALMMFDVIVVLGVGVSIWVAFFDIIRPLKDSIGRLQKINYSANLRNVKIAEENLVSGRAINYFEHLLDALCLEYEKNKSELKAYSEQMALRASMIRELRQEFEKKVFDLFTLFDVAKELNSTLNPETISQLIVLTCMGQMGVSNTTVFQLEESLDYTLRLRDSRGLNFKPDKDFRIDASSKFIRHITSQARALTIQEMEPVFSNDVEFNKLRKLKPALVISFIDKNETKVMILIGQKMSGEMFSKDDIEFLTVLTNIGGLALENAKLYSMAITDGLTKLYLQRYFVFKADEEVKRASRYAQPMSIIMIDIDNFKKINDTYGHLDGNKVLLAVADIIRKSIRETDLPARYGGEEFAILMPMTNKKAAMVVAERMRSSIEKSNVYLKDGTLTITISIGVASFPEDGDNANLILNCADDMLYEAKRTGKNKVCVSPVGFDEKDKLNG